MSFVAQPYERFADDLLTALTGGVIREEHTFAGAEGQYSLSTPGVEAGTVKLSGQRNGAFALFAPGTDYDYDAASGAVTWRAGGRVPDDRSPFYVSYYPQEAVRTLTDRNPGSVNATLTKAFARELAVLHRQMEGIYQSAFLDLATGNALDHVVALLGLTRRDAKFASGEVVFKRATPAPGDIAIPAGTLVSTSQGQNFETTDRRTLRKGQLAVAAPIRARAEGPDGRVDAGVIANVNRPIFGVEAVVNEAATFFASQRETDEELRRRMQGTLERAGKATLDAIRYALIEEIPEITEVNIQVAEQAATPGLVEVRLGLESAGDGDLVRRIEETLFATRPAGVRVTHNLPTRSSGRPGALGGITRDQALADFAAQAEPPGTRHLPPEVLEAMPQGAIALRIEVFLRLAQVNLSAAQKESIEDGVRQTIRDYVEALPMGTPLLFNKLLGRIVAPDAILDAAMLVGAEAHGTFTGYADNLATEGRKATIDNARIFVGLMDEVVQIDLTVTLESKHETPADPGPLREALKEGGTLHRQVEVAAAGTLTATAATLARGDLEGAIRPLVEAASPALQFIAPRGVVLSAEYVESGRLVNDTDQLALAPNEVPTLRKLTLKLKDNLDV